MTPPDKPPGPPRRPARRPRSSAPASASFPQPGADCPHPSASASGTTSESAPQLRIGGPGFLTGQMLIAMPGLTSPPFAQSVIYLCAHTAEGAMGIVLNRPLASPSFDDLLRQLDIAPTPPARRIRLCSGGPVDNARGFVLHTADWTGDGSLRVDDAVALTASLDVLKAIAGGGGPKEGLLALGYAGWGAGQLEAEIGQNSWLSAPADLGLVFDAGHDSKWRRALGLLKIDPLLLSSFAGRA